MHRIKDDRGAAAVEFAIVLPVLLLLVIGIMEIGRLVQVQATVSAAAREGARVMAVEDDPRAAREAVLSSATSLAPVLRADQISVSPASCTDTSATTTVTVQYTAEWLTGFAGVFTGGFDISGEAAMRCGG